METMRSKRLDPMVKDAVACAQATTAGLPPSLQNGFAAWAIQNAVQQGEIDKYIAVWQAAVAAILIAHPEVNLAKALYPQITDANQSTT